MKKTLSADSYIVKKYEEFWKNNSHNIESHDLKEYLVDLLNDPKNY